MRSIHQGMNEQPIVLKASSKSSTGLKSGTASSTKDNSLANCCAQDDHNGSALSSA
eukprot:CAMPEP_0170302628 /NCGR_PEP_ID=MMETSP0116_2-20130129/51607_1 /TAXON_ID=400756 /ORGANISM="Durinskia baltica, Strain CSIRO CS-38" /LENGTH=55 /DNA_ID=CAMNT_0010554517 /DNA_START=211 /DNA_END=374 /DNA_ORIENTATION=-